MASDSPVLIVAGVAGSGKSSVAQEVADRLGWAYLEGDDYHPDANLAKMRTGQALTDEDRWPWLEQLKRKIDHALYQGDAAVLACSALKAEYVRYLVEDRPRVRVVFLRVSYEEAHRRLLVRDEHFFPAELLESQFAIVEEPDWVVDGEQQEGEIIDQILAELS